MYSVHQHWDPLKVCVVGTTYGPEHYSWILDARLRGIFEKIASETVEDLDNLAQILKSHGVDVMRPTLEPTQVKRTPPPMVPRDWMIMVGNTFYENISECDETVNNIKFSEAYRDIKDPAWDDYYSYWDFQRHAPEWIKEEVHATIPLSVPKHAYTEIFEHISKQGNTIKTNAYNHHALNGACVSRIGKDLYWSTQRDDALDVEAPDILAFAGKEFASYRNTVVNTGGHSDGVYCPVVPGLIISTNYVTEYKDTFPDWEIVFLPDQGKNAVRPFLDLKLKNQGRWWIPGYEYDNALIEFVDTYMDDWVGFVEETVFDVNMLVIDTKNVIIFGEHQQTIDALERHGVTPHIAKLRHRYFWDGGIHCVTTDLHREGNQQDYFPNRLSDRILHKGD